MTTGTHPDTDTDAGTDTGTSALRTGWEDSVGSGDSLALATLRAMGERAADHARAAGGRVRREPGLLLADAGSPCPFLNLACAARPLDAAAAQALAGFFAPSTPFVLISPHPTPDLHPAGLTLMGHPPLMVRPPGSPTGAPPEPGGLTVSEVRDADTLAVWDRVLAAGYPVPLSPTPPTLLGGPARFWLGSLRGEPVATALSRTAHGVVDVEAVATQPEHRGRGIGAALTWAATRADPALPAVLIASDDGAGTYRRLGYLAVMRWTLWLRG